MELAGLVRSEGKLDFIARDQVSAQIETRQRKPCGKSGVESTKVTGWPLTTLSSLGMNSNFTALIVDATQFAFGVAICLVAGVFLTKAIRNFLKK
jgi:hypothetical protein